MPYPKIKRCKKCKKMIKHVYTYCATCYNEINNHAFFEPKTTKTQTCIDCGKPVNIRYIRCFDCHIKSINNP